MGFLYKTTKMVESYAGGNSCDDNDDLTVREKVIEFAQEKVAEREMEKCQPGYVEKHKSIVEKAVEAAEGYIAKQGESYRDDDDDSCSSSSSSSDSSSECETKEYASYTKTTRDIPGTDTRVEEVTVSVRTTTTPEYPTISTQNYNSSSYRQDDRYGAFNRATMESNDVSSSSEYRSTQIRDETEYGTKEYSSYSRTTRDDSDGYRPGNYGDASSSYSTRTTAVPEYSSDVSSYSSVGRQNDDYGALNRMPLEGNSVFSTSEYRSTRIHDEDEYERKEYSSCTRTSRDESDGVGGATSGYATRVDEEVDYSVRATTSPEYMGNSSREYNSSSYQRTIRQDDNCDAFNRMTLESNDTAYRSTREREERNEYSSYSRTSRDESAYSTRVDEEVNVSVRTTSTPEYCTNSTPNYSSSSYRSERREDDSCGAFNDVSSSSEYRSTRVDGAGCETEEYSSYSRTSRDDSSEYRPGNFAGASSSYSARVDEQGSYSSRTTSAEFSSRPTGGVYGTRELQSYGGNSVQIDLDALMVEVENGNTSIRCFGLAYYNTPADIVTRFAKKLGDPNSALANGMRELCLSADNAEFPMTDGNVKAFLDVLKTNHKLIYLDLLVLPALFDKYAAAFRAHHQETLCVEKEKLPLRCRLAFLSVVRGHSTPAIDTFLHLDDHLLKNIFAFAAVSAKRTVCLRCDH